MSEINEAQVKGALKEVIEPVLGRDLVSLGWVKRCQVEGGKVKIGVELPTPVYRDREGLTEKLRAAAQRAGAAPGAVEVELSVNTPMGTRGAATRLPTVRNVIAVAAGKGGVGKSTISTNLALSLQRLGARVGLLDADIYGPSVPTMLGPPERPPGTRPPHQIVPALHYGLSVISVGFFTEREGAVVWRGPMVHKLLQQFLEDVEWGELDYLVVDLPPGTGDAQLSLSQLIPITGAVMVTTPQEVALIDVEKAVSMFKKVEVPILGVVENMSYYVCPTCGHHDEIFDRGGGKQLAETLKVSFLGEVPIDARVRRGGDAGLPIVVGAPSSEHAQIFTEMALRVSESVMKLVCGGPRRPAGLVQIR
jgi:ATP-binding protein involved in chromosome partitioning